MKNIVDVKEKRISIAKIFLSNKRNNDSERTSKDETIKKN